MTIAIFALLLQSNAQSRVFEDVFLKANMPFKIVGGQRFYERMEIKDLLLAITTLSEPNGTISVSDDVVNSLNVVSETRWYRQTRSLCRDA